MAPSSMLSREPATVFAGSCRETPKKRGMSLFLSGTGSPRPHRIVEPDGNRLRERPNPAP